jgi:hypothetical protein
MTETQLKGYADQIEAIVTVETPAGFGGKHRRTHIGPEASLGLAELIERMIEQKFAELQQT